MKSTRRGKFIALEGADGSGTTTQATRVAKSLGARGLSVVVTCEPTAGNIGALLRHLLATTKAGASGGPSAAEVGLLFAADRLDHLRREIEPALAGGAWVISDRYVLSSLVYQGVELPLWWVRAINRTAPPPDLTLLIDVPEIVARKRRAGRGGTHERFDHAAFQKQVVLRYRRLSKTFPRLQVVDGTRNPDDVTADILRVIARRRWLAR